METDNRSKKWERIQKMIADRFADGEIPDEDAILFLIGVRELGSARQKFKKHEKLDLLHIAICRVLLPYGYYRRTGLDEDGWPHYQLIEKLPPLKSGEQGILIKQAIIRYFEEEDLLD